MIPKGAGSRNSDRESELRDSNCFIRASYEAMDHVKFPKYFNRLLEFYGAKVVKQSHDYDYGGFKFYLSAPEFYTRPEGTPRICIENIHYHLVDRWYFRDHVVWGKNGRRQAIAEHGMLVKY